MTRGQPAYLTNEEREARKIARAVVKSAISRGVLVRGECVAKGQHRGGIVAHHRNGYADAMDVVWLCAMHHGMEHYEQNRERRFAFREGIA